MFFFWEERKAQVEEKKMMKYERRQVNGIDDMTVFSLPISVRKTTILASASREGGDGVYLVL